MRNLLVVSCLCLCLTASAQYSESFSTPDKGYLLNLLDDFTGVNWSMTPWLTGGGERDAADNFQTTAAGMLESLDLDDEVCWESPLLNIAAAGMVSLSVDLTWAGFDNDATLDQCTYFPVASLDYIKVMYSVNGGTYVMVPNQVGGAICATIGYTFGAGNGLNGNATVTHNGISGNTLKVRVCVGTNANAEIVTVDNVSVPETGVSIATSGMPVIKTQAETMVISPNPTEGDFIISPITGHSGSGTVFLQNSLGQICIQTQVPDLQRPFRLNASHLPEGLYVIHVSNGSQHASGRVVIQRGH